MESEERACEVFGIPDVFCFFPKGFPPPQYYSVFFPKGVNLAPALWSLTTASAVPLYRQFWSLVLLVSDNPLILPNFTRFHLLLTDLTKFLPDSIKFNVILSDDFTVYQIVTDFAGFYQILSDITRFYQI